MRVEPRDGGFGIYVHWPFCQAKCPYCDFNSHVVAHVDQTQWRQAFENEIARYHEFTSDRRVDSVYFGGGTPSLMEGATVAAILDAIRSRWSVANDFEVTLEANPTSVERNRFAAYRDAGVNRISIGIQALNNVDLQRLGRRHTVEDGLAAIALARDMFERVSFDLIYGRQDQGLADWLQELDRALALAPDHISLYQLTIEPGTAFFERQERGTLRGLPDEDLSADLYEATMDRANAAGLSAYEVSNLARPGAESVHNMIYWSGGEYLGIGPGAHGRVQVKGKRWATVSVKEPMRWLRLAMKNGVEGEDWSELSLEEQLIEYMMMGLRTDQGVCFDRLINLNLSNLQKNRLVALKDEGYILWDGARIRTTAQGRLVLNAVLRDILV